MITDLPDEVVVAIQKLREVAPDECEVLADYIGAANEACCGCGWPDGVVNLLAPPEGEER
jgi:hypothetical protein